MSVTSTIANVYQYTGSLLSLSTGGLLNVSVLNTGGGAQTATFVDDDGTLTQASDGVATASISGGTAGAIDYLGAGTASTVTLLGIPLLAVPVMAFKVDGDVYLHFPNGLPPLSGLLISFDIDPGAAFNLPNPMPICLANGTRLHTARGLIAVERLALGDMVQTLDHGLQPIRWTGQRMVCRAEQMIEPRLRPVRIAAGALGPGRPRRDLQVTQQHRILVRIGKVEMLVAARHLIGRKGISLAPVERRHSYHHLLFDRHEIILAEGCATESLYLGEQAIKALPGPARREIDLLFPMLATGERPEAARPFLTRREVMAQRVLNGLGAGRIAV